MPVRIHYVSLPEDGNSQNAAPKPAQGHIKWDQILDELTSNVRRCLLERDHLLPLRCSEKGMESTGAYFSYEINGIIADFQCTKTLVPCNRRIVHLVFDEFDTEKSQCVCHLPAGLLHDSEYQTLMREPTAGRKHVLSGLPVATAKPCKVYGDDADVYGIPVFRCASDGDWRKPASIEEWIRPTVIYGLLQYLARKNFIPSRDVMGEACGAVPEEELLEFLKGAKFSQERGAKVSVQKADKNGNAEEKKNWKAIMDYYGETGRRVANLARYPDSILQIHGSWDLYPFAKFEKREDLPFINGTWYEVSGLYARDPQEDIAPDVECVAIDFGTANTVAAIYPVNGSITTMPIGGGEGCGQIDNPTILKFQDIRSFLAAYEQSQYRPDTKFEQVTTSHTAKQDFEAPAQDGHEKNMLQYLNQLKQWVNEPNRLIQLTDRHSDCDITLGREMDLTKTKTMVDPIELYAYYIGMSINDMRWGKIYLQYLLSYSATYSEYSREWIRSSFEKGLRKALPPNVGENAKLDVRLWRDEATSYAICALSRYLLADEDARAQNQSIFYGIYDFGGGTLDFSFGVMESVIESVMESDQKTERRCFTQLQRGGSPVLGCENMLDELAFKLFSENAAALQQKNIKCNIPFGTDPRQHLNNPVVGESEAARFNTCSLTAYLRNKWIGPKLRTANFSDSADETLEDDEHFDGFTLYSENGDKYEWTGQERTAANGIEMKISSDTIQNFFREKVLNGIDLFLDCYQKVISREENQSYSTLPCHVFLAGNASRAPLVYSLFQEKTASEDFEVHPPLPTKEDHLKKQEEPYLDIPTAKSGVAYGLLMSRPGVEDVAVKSRLPEVNFHYHIGLRTKSTLNGGRGMFQLSLEKSSIPKYDAGKFRKVRKVPQNQKIFEILYTFDDSYTLTEAGRKIDSSVKALSVHIPDAYAEKECYLYIRARPNSDIAAELGVSFKENDCLLEEQVCLIGTCDFAQGGFTPGAMDVKSDSDLDSKPGALPPQKRNDTHLPVPSDKTLDYRLGILQDNKMPLWKLDTDIFQTGKRPRYLCDVRENSFVLCYSPKGDSQWDQVTVTLEGTGTKKVFVLGTAGSTSVKIGYNSMGEQYEFYLNLKTKEFFEHYEGGND